MTKHNEELTLDDVLNELVADHAFPTTDAIEAAARQYPQYRRELVEFAAVWTEQRSLPPSPELGGEQEKLLVDRAMSHVANIACIGADQAAAHGKNKSALSSLIADAQALGYTPESFARACGLDLPIIAKLNNRQVDPGTIPAKLISHVSRLLNRPVAVVADFLTASAAASITRSSGPLNKPEDSNRESFADALRVSTLSEEERVRWLDPENGSRGG